MNKTKLYFSIILPLLLLPLYGQEVDKADEALLIHKHNLWQNFHKLQSSELSSGYKDFDAQYYKLDLEIEFGPNLLSGKVSGRYKSLVNSLDQLKLDFDDQLTISAVQGPVSSYEHSGQILTINLSQDFMAGETFEVTVEYSGIPDPGNRRWFVFDKLSDGSDHVWTLSEPYGARYWWPCKDTPADKADSVDIIVTVPADQIVASNGTLISAVISDNKRTFHWHEKYPITTYLVSLAIAPFVQFQDIYTSASGQSMLLDYYAYPQQEALAREIFPNTKNHLDALSTYFGTYPFIDEKYGLAQFGWTSGAMEHQTISSIGRVSRNWEYVYVHELGHQWFGDALTCASWTDIWLNEGFASYSEALYAEYNGYNDLPAGEESYKEYILGQSYFNDGTIIIQDTLSLSSVFGRIVYNKGSWVLHMLRGVLGDDDFFESLYLYANGDLQYTSVRNEDFKNVCEQVSGKNLAAFFDQWLNYPYYPTYIYFWELDQNGLINVNILQKNASIIYEMPIELKFIFASGADTVVTVDNYLQEQNYTFSFAEKPVELILDPDNWILKDAQDKSGGEFLPEIVVENIYPNPANTTVNIDVIYWGQDKIKLKIFDINGREINRIYPYISSRIHRHYFRWNGNDRFGNPVAAGMYFIEPVSADYKTRAIKKVILLK